MNYLNISLWIVCPMPTEKPMGSPSWWPESSHIHQATQEWAASLEQLLLIRWLPKARADRQIHYYVSYQWPISHDYSATLIYTMLANNANIAYCCKRCTKKVITSHRSTCLFRYLVDIVIMKHCRPHCQNTICNRKLSQCIRNLRNCNVIFIYFRCNRALVLFLCIQSV